MIAITSLFVVAAVVLAIKSKDRWITMVVILVAGIALGGTDFGHSVISNLDGMAAGLDNWIKSWVH
jgi:hypothetical protein